MSKQEYKKYSQNITDLNILTNINNNSGMSKQQNRALYAVSKNGQNMLSEEEAGRWVGQLRGEL